MLEHQCLIPPPPTFWSTGLPATKSHPHGDFLQKKIRIRDAMTNHKSLFLLAFVSIVANAWSTAWAADRDKTAAVLTKPTELSFEKDIKPILRAHCLDCHGGVEGKKGNLDLRLVRTMTSGGKQGPAINRGHADESLLVARIEDGEMPPKGCWCHTLGTPKNQGVDLCGCQNSPPRTCSRIARQNFGPDGRRSFILGISADPESGRTPNRPSRSVPKCHRCLFTGQIKAHWLALPA